MNAEQMWGPYLSERQWGTVREDYSDHGDAWNYFARMMHLFATVSAEQVLDHRKPTVARESSQTAYAQSGRESA